MTPDPRGCGPWCPIDGTGHCPTCGGYRPDHRPGGLVGQLTDLARCLTVGAWVAALLRRRSTR